MCCRCIIEEGVQGNSYWHHRCQIDATVLWFSDLMWRWYKWCQCTAVELETRQKESFFASKRSDNESTSGHESLCRHWFRFDLHKHQVHRTLVRFPKLSWNQVRRAGIKFCCWQYSHTPRIYLLENSVYYQMSNRRRAAPDRRGPAGDSEL